MPKVAFKTAEEAEAFASGLSLAVNLELDNDPVLSVDDMIYEAGAEKPYVVLIAARYATVSDTMLADSLDVLPTRPDWHH
ncbi:MAG: hypothetical protein RSD49_07975 [Hafnia sp.]